MSWEYKKDNKWYKFSKEIQKLIEKQYNDNYGYVEFIDDTKFPDDNLTIVFYKDKDHELLNVYNEDIKSVRRINIQNTDYIFESKKV